MVLQLFTDPLAPCGLRTQLVLHEKGVSYELKTVDLRNREHKTPKFLDTKNPFGVIPYLDDDGFILFESRAICHYIVSKYPDQGTPNLIPTGELKANALYQQATIIELNSFADFTEKIAVEGVFKPLRGETTNKEFVARQAEQLNARLDAYERILSKRKYLAGDTISLADLFHIPYGSLLPVAGIHLLEVESRPNVARWWKDISSRPSWQAVKGTLEAYVHHKL